MPNPPVLPDDALPLLAALTLALLALFWLWRRWRARVRLERRPLLTAAELEMWGLLRAACPGHEIGCQVSMGALLRPRRGISRRAARLARNKVSQKVVDFVVVNPATGLVEAVVELDDSTHDARRDAARDRLLAQGGYRVIRIPSKPRPTRESVAARLAEFRTPARR